MGLPFAYEAYSHFDPTPLVDPLHRCPYCSFTSSDSNSLEDHLSYSHLGHEPVLFLSGKPQKKEDCIRICFESEIMELDIYEFEKALITCGASSFEFNSDGIREFREHILRLSQQNLRVQVRIWGDPGRGMIEPITHKIDLCILDKESIHEVDARFHSLQLMHDDRPIDDLELSIRELSEELREEKVSFYVLGIWHFVRALKLKRVMDKHQGDLIRKQLNLALKYISDVPSPLAAAIEGFLRFNLNHFSRIYRASGIRDLDSLLGLLRRIGPMQSDDNSNDHLNAATGIDPTWAIPSDPHTEHLINLAYCGFDQAFDENAVMPFEEDEDKRLAILSFMALHAKRPDLAQPLLARLGPQHPCFGSWVSQHMQRTP